MKRMSLAIFVSIGMFSFSIPLAVAAPLAKDFALSVSASPATSVIKSGDAVALTYTITNVGTNSLNPILEEYIYLAPEFTFQSVSSSDLYLECTDWYTLGEFGTYNPKYDDYSFAPCFGSENLAPLSPGGSYSFTVHTIANSNFIDGTTKAFGIHYPSFFNEDDQSTALAELLNVVDNGAEFETVNSNNLATYSYSAPTTATTTQPVPANNSSGDPDVEVSDKSSSALDSTQGSATGEALVTENEDEPFVTDKAKVAIDKKLNVPDRITQPDNNRPRVGLSEKYKDEFLSVTLISIVAGIVAYFIRRRYLRTISKQRDYKNALKVMENSSN